MMYPVALDIGISPAEFWGYSAGEIVHLLESHKRQERIRQKEKATFQMILARQIGEQVAKLFDDKNEVNITPLWEYFPDLFREEKLQSEEQEKQHQLEIFKAKMEAFALRHNARFARMQKKKHEEEVKNCQTE